MILEEFYNARYFIHNSEKVSLEAFNQIKLGSFDLLVFFHYATQASRYVKLENFKTSIEILYVSTQRIVSSIRSFQSNTESPTKLFDPYLPAVQAAQTHWERFRTHGWNVAWNRLHQRVPLRQRFPRILQHFQPLFASDANEIGADRRAAHQFVRPDSTKEIRRRLANRWRLRGGKRFSVERSPVVIDYFYYEADVLDVFRRHVEHQDLVVHREQRVLFHRGLLLFDSPVLAQQVHLHVRVWKCVCRALGIFPVCHWRETQRGSGELEESPPRIVVSEEYVKRRIIANFVTGRCRVESALRGQILLGKSKNIRCYSLVRAFSRRKREILSHFSPVRKCNANFSSGMIKTRLGHLRQCAINNSRGFKYLQGT